MKKEPQPSDVHGVELPPEEHVSCFDYLYYLCAQTVRDPTAIYDSSPYLNGDSRSSIISTLALRGGSSSSISVGQSGFRVSPMVT